MKCLTHNSDGFHGKDTDAEEDRPAHERSDLGHVLRRGKVLDQVVECDAKPQTHEHVGHLVRARGGLW